jgi:hypothetical protein
MQLEELPWDPDRVLKGLSRIGYSPVAAILDLVDNSVSAGATVIKIFLDTRTEPSASGRGRPRVLLDRIRIEDDGSGMTRPQLLNALSLGSDPAHYVPGTLSKFGLGMKSASGSLGRRLRVTSRATGAEAIVGILDQDVIAAERKYVCRIGEAVLPEDAIEGQSGTRLLIDNLHSDLPSHSEIKSELQRMLGLTYSYFLTGRAGGRTLRITFGDESIVPFDPLFVSELNDTDLLDENTWDGCSVQWLSKPHSIQVAHGVNAIFTVTQLPHPPSMKEAGKMTQAECRNKYDIGANQYGVYIYRNGRLIGNAVDMGMIARDQDAYSYRARLEITDSADEALRIDVAKSRIQLSEIATDQLTETVRETLRKSKAAWRRAKSIADQRNHEDATASVNEGLDRIARQGVEALHEEIEAAPPDERDGLEQAVAEEVDQLAPNPGALEEVKERKRRVVYEEYLPDNQLWDRNYHPEHGAIAVVNGAHRFCTDVLRSDAAPAALQRAFDVLIFALAEGERQLMLEHRTERDKVEALLKDYRAIVGEELSGLLRKLDTDILRD